MAPTSRTPGSPDSSAPPTDGKDWPDEVEPPAGRRQPGHLEDNASNITRCGCRTNWMTLFVYTSWAFGQHLRTAGLLASMGTVGDVTTMP